MIVADKIYQQVGVLPEPLQAEVLDFVEFLLQKVRASEQTSDAVADIDNLAWSKVSLEMAMRGMENEDEPLYSLQDLTETF